MKKILCLILIFTLLFCVSCNVADGGDILSDPPSESNPEVPESSSTPIEESTPAPDSSESEPDTTQPHSESPEIIVDPDFHKNYNMFLYGDTWSEYFIDDVSVLKYDTGEYVSDSIAEEKSVVYNGNSVKLDYQASSKLTSAITDEYVSTDGKIKVKYCSETGKLYSFSDWALDMSDLPNSEDEYKKIIASLMQQMTGITLSENEYVYSCETIYRIYSNDFISNNITVPYFYFSENPEEKIVFYHIRYDYLVDGYKTTDGIYAHFSYQGIMIIFFDRLQFRNITNIDLEYEDAKAAVESFCRAYFSDDREVISVDIEDCCLTFIEDKMYLDCSVGIEFIHKDSSYSILESILIEIE